MIDIRGISVGEHRVNNLSITDDNKVMPAENEIQRQEIECGEGV